MFILAMTIFAGSASCPINNIEPGNAPTDSNITDTMGFKIKITIGSKTFSATIQHSSASAKFKSMLPLTLDMTELNGNEKYAALPASLPTDPANPGKLQAGDLMLYGASTLVLFYETFSTPYSYTRLGKIENTEGLAAALGSGNVSSIIELQQ